MSTATEPRPATLEELKARHAKTPAQLAALRAASAELNAAHAGKCVAYADEWDGDTLRRTVLISTANEAEFQRLLAELPAPVRARVQLTYAPETNAIGTPVRGE
jgi:hypothetical protein